jgi:hypothetical protein
MTRDFGLFRQKYFCFPNLVLQKVSRKYLSPESFEKICRKIGANARGSLKKIVVFAQKFIYFR